jgi:diguanylate cyclase (GGDEF)-like protein
MEGVEKQFAQQKAETPIDELSRRAAVEEQRLREIAELKAKLATAEATAESQRTQLANQRALIVESDARLMSLEVQLGDALHEKSKAATQVMRVKMVLEGANQEVALLKEENQRLTNENQRLTIENERREQMAQTDELTGLLNRHGFKTIAPTMFEMYKGLARETTPHAGQRARENKLDVSFNAVYIDLNGFKEINDTVSHSAGDEALKRVAEALQGSVRKSDTVFRMGGDEFLIVFISREDPESKRDTLAHNKLLEENRFIVAERIRRKLAQTAGTAVDKNGIQVDIPPMTAMIGVAQYVPVPGEGINEVIQAADAEALKLKEKKKQDKLAWEADPEHAGKPYPYTTEIAYAQPIE